MALMNAVAELHDIALEELAAGNEKSKTGNGAGPTPKVSGPPPIKPVKPISTGLRKGAKPLGR
jgi:hypothetical protein